LLVVAVATSSTFDRELLLAMGLLAARPTCGSGNLLQVGRGPPTLEVVAAAAAQRALNPQATGTHEVVLEDPLQSASLLAERTLWWSVDHFQRLSPKTRRIQMAPSHRSVVWLYSGE
jgi:hypothetical protein